MPVISTWSPLFSSPRVTSARQAVSPASGRAAASGQLRCSGMGASRSMGSAIFSAKVPCSGMPRMRNVFGSCARGSGPQPLQGITTTLRPTHARSTAGATDSTTPAPSEPSTEGSCIFAYSPWRMNSSRWLSAAAWRRTTAPPAGATGSGTCSTCNCSPILCSRTARMRSPRWVGLGACFAFRAKRKQSANHQSARNTTSDECSVS